MTNIQISDSVWSYLNAQKQPGESFDDVIRRETGYDKHEVDA